MAVQTTVTVGLIRPPNDSQTTKATAAGERRRGVEVNLRTEDHRHFAGEHVAQDAAGDTPVTTPSSTATGGAKCMATPLRVPMMVKSASAKASATSRKPRGSSRTRRMKNVTQR